MANAVAKGSCSPGSSPLLMWLAVIDVAGTVTDLLPGHAASMSYAVYDRGRQVGATGALVVADTVYGVRQTGTTWTRAVGAAGGNVAVRLPGSYLASANKTYAVAVTVNLTGGTTFVLEGRITTLRSNH